MLSYEDINCINQEKEKLIREMIDQCKANGNIGTIDTYAHTIKNLCKIVEDAEKEIGYSNGFSGMYQGQNMPNMGYSGNSFQMMPNTGFSGGRGPNANRDSMGRYSSHGDMKAHLYEALNAATNEMERQNIQNLINNMP